MIYSFHHFYEWLRGGVESGMAYRAKVFRSLGLEAKFVFATMFPNINIQQETERLGFLDSEVIWLYTFFTDCKISPVTYTLEQLENSFGEEIYVCSREGALVKYVFPGTGRYYEVSLSDGINDYVHRVRMISNGYLIRQDYYTYCRVYSEYYAPVEGWARLYLRRFFNEDGTVAYEEIIDDDVIIYRLADRVLYSREELVEHMMSYLHLKENDVVIIDGEPGMIERSSFIRGSHPAKVGFMIHSNHYLQCDENHILWYGFFEYALEHPEKVNFYITNTEEQSALLREQFKKYKGINPMVVAIPVAGLDTLKKPQSSRKRHSLLSAGRLVEAKHMNWVIEAVVEARKKIPDITLDIYGEGGEKNNLQMQIDKLGCGNYVYLCGFQKLDDIYQKYDAYIAPPFPETFGVTLLEAVGSGLPIVGCDIGYGATVFVDEGKNGYKVPWGDIKGLAEAIVRLFTEADIEEFRKNSYKKAEMYLTGEVAKRWQDVLNQMI